MHKIKKIIKEASYIEIVVFQNISFVTYKGMHFKSRPVVSENEGFKFNENLGSPILPNKFTCSKLRITSLRR